MENKYMQIIEDAIDHGLTIFKSYIYLTIGLMINVSANNVTIQQPICQDFLNLELRKEMTVPMKENKSILIDINNDGQDENVTLNTDIAHDTNIWYNSLSYPQQYKTTTDLELRWFRGQQVLLYNNHYYIAYFETIKKIKPKYITSIDIMKDKNIEHAICKFKNKEKLILSKESNASLCTNLLKKYKKDKKDKIIIFDIPSKFKFESTKTSNDYGVNPKKTIIGNIAYFDFNNDTVKEYVQLFEGRYNGMKHYKKINKEEMKLIDMRNGGLSDVKGEWLRYQDKVYFVNGSISSIDYPISIGLIEHNTSKNVCTYRISSDIRLDINQTKSLIKKIK